MVTDGTARRVNNVFVDADGRPLVGRRQDRNRRQPLSSDSGSGGALISSKAVNRTATFVFYIGDRFFGTVTAYVDGEDADRYDFTSALAVQLLKVLEPELRPLIKGKEPVQQALLGSSQAPAAPKKGAAGRKRVLGRGGCAPHPRSPRITAGRPSRRGAVSEIPAISATSLRVIASAKLWKSSTVIRNAPGPPVTFSR